MERAAAGCRSACHHVGKSPVHVEMAFLKTLRKQDVEIHAVVNALGTHVPAYAMPSTWMGHDP